MKVLMKVTTHFEGIKEQGKEYDIDSVIAKRWEVNGIAELVEETEIEEEIEEEVEETEVETDYSKMSAKRLYALCKERGIEAESKKSKEYYIDLLEAFQE